MEILSQHGDPALAEVLVLRFRGDDRFLAECVDARDPEVDPDKKWVIIVSTQFGCPVGCLMCDSGGGYRGDLTAEEILRQVDAVVGRHPRERLLRAEKFKVQFARMGEPALNPAVLEALCELPRRYDAPGLIPCVATTAPAAARGWFEELLMLRRGLYAGREFQLQLSINSTDERNRDRLMPVPKFSLEELGKYARCFHEGMPGRKVALNFALTEGIAVDAGTIARHFDPTCCCVKVTPLNPTLRSAQSGLRTALPPEAPERAHTLCEALTAAGFDAIVSIGDVRENAIGSNCGMAVRRISARSGTAAG